MKKNFFISIFSCCFLLVNISYGQIKNTPTSDFKFNVTESTLQQIKASAISNEIIELPNQFGVYEEYFTASNNLLSIKLQAEYPGLKTFDLIKVNENSILGSLVINDSFLLAIIDEPGGWINISPDDLSNPETYTVVKGVDVKEEDHGECGNTENHETPAHKAKVQNITKAADALSYGSSLSTFELVIVTTNEFYAENGGTVPSAMAVVTSSVAALNLIYKKELAVDFTLKDTKIYMTAGGDPDPFVSGGDSRPNMAAETVALWWADSFYDIGHVLHDTSPASGLGGGGVAGLGVICDDGTFFSMETPDDGLSGPNKSAAWSGASSNTSNGWHQLFGHEVGHQFGAHHTWNGSGSSCTTANFNLATAVEIGSGTTIMSYNGICSPSQNIPDGGSADNYFHSVSLDEMRTEIGLGTVTCETTTATANTPPTCDANPTSGTFTIPMGTPFELTGSGSDADGDALTYLWEQIDVSPTSTQGDIGTAAAANTDGPNFRSVPPSTSPTRIFPSLPNILAGTNTGLDFEALSSVGRTMDFAFIVRDNSTLSGGVCSSPLSITVDGTTGPFEVTSQGTPTSWTADGSSMATVTWSVAGTTGGTVLCSSVDILFSTDNGETFPHTIASSTANDGTHTFLIPNLVTAEGRVKVKCSGNIFFDINNDLISISSSCAANGASFSPGTDVTAPVGDPSLDLSLSPDYGSLYSTFSGTITSTDSPANLVRSSSATPTCDISGNDVLYDEFSIYPATTGAYSFAGLTTPLVANLYEHTFFPSQLCTNWLSTSAVKIGAGPTTVYSDLPATGLIPTTVTLTAGTEYLLTVSNFSPTAPTLPASYSITYTGPSSLFDGPIEPATGSYSYTFVITSSSGTILAFSTDPDLSTGFGAGTYEVCGLSYLSTETLTGYVSGPLSTLESDLLDLTICGNKSSNSITVTITSTCPTLTSPAPAVVITSESTCTVFGGTPSGGVLSAPTGSCPSGSTLEYSTDAGATWGTTLPLYDQDDPITVLTRCLCDDDGTTASPTSTVTTTPGTCPLCPVLTAAAPAVVISSESTCTVFGGTPSGGVLSAPTGSCPTGSTLQYSTDAGTTWGTTLPLYDQDDPITVLTRCNCDAVTTTNSPTSTVTTTPGTCPSCPVLTAAAPVVVITSESTCTVFGGTPSGGVLSAPTGSCPTGSTLQYSTDAGTTWGTTLPLYDQDTPLTVLTRCNCDAVTTTNSPTSSITTAPGACPGCPTFTLPAPPVVITSESSCTTFGGSPSGGILSAPTGSCPSGSTLEYSTDGGTTWSTTLPLYDQDDPITILTRCLCDDDGTTASPFSSVTTTPGTICPPCPVLTAAAPAAVITSESSCIVVGGTPSGGVISAPTGTCPTGSTLMYSVDGGPFTTTLPTYVQTTSITIDTRCDCDAVSTTTSPISTIVTTPGSCPVCLTPTACDDGDPCTSGDLETFDSIGGICVPCAGTVDPSACAAPCVTFSPCDDGDPDTEDDVVGLAADGSICVPCEGTPLECEGLNIVFNIGSIVVWESTPISLASVVSLSYDNGDPVTGTGTFTILNEIGTVLISGATEIPFSLPIGGTYTLVYDYIQDADPGSGIEACTDSASHTFKILSIGCD